jgi:hypothetical protein
MSDRFSVAAAWAISSKRPGNPQGYETASAPEDAKTAGRLVVLAESMGTPRGLRSGSSDELPWVTFTGGGSSAAPMLAVATIAWSHERDGTGQPITPARAVWLPWPEVARRRLTYSALLEGVGRLRWPEVDAGPEDAAGHETQVCVPPRDTRQIIDEISRWSFDFVARIAVLLVDGRRVAIVLRPDEVVPLTERLRLLDAVLALLPFGARNCLTVATWASYQAGQAAALTFSDGVQSDQVGVSLSDFREPVRCGERGEDYLRELAAIRDQGFDVAAIVDHLAARTEPVRRVADLSLETLSDIRFASVVYEEVKRSAGSVERVGRALREGNFPELYLQTFAAFLAESACTAPRKEARRAGDLLVSEWSPVFPKVFGDLTRSAPERVPDGESKWLELCQKATSHEGAVAYLARALRPPLVLAGDDAFEGMVTLTVRYLSSPELVNAVAHRVLIAQPYVFLQALSAILSPSANNRWRRMADDLKHRFGSAVSPTLVALSGFVASGEPAWLRPVLLAPRGQEARFEPRDLEALADLGPAAVACFVDLLAPKAGSTATVEICWPAVARLLRAPKANAEIGDLARSLLSLQSENHREPAVDHRARIDFLCLTVSQAPRYGDLVESASQAYLDAFRRILEGVDAGWVAQVIERLFGHLHRSFSSVSPEAVQRLDKALGIGVTRQYLAHLASWLGEGRIREVRALDLPVEWRNELKALPELAWFRALCELESLVTANFGAAAVCEKATEALRNPVSADEVARVLNAFIGRVEAVEAELLLRRLYRCDGTGRYVASLVRDHAFEVRLGGFALHVDKLHEYSQWLLQGRADQEKTR